MFSKIIALALAVGHCQASKTWIRGGLSCIGVDTTMPKTVMYGPCTPESTADLYVSQTLVGAGKTLNADTYFKNMDTQMEAVTFASPEMTAVRADENIKGTDGCVYAAAQASAKLGDGKVTAQYAAVINTGEHECAAKNIKVVEPRAAGDDVVTETKDICIDCESAGTTCAERKFDSGAIKFSAGVAFADGFTLGNVFTDSTDRGATEYLGYRLKYDFSKFGKDAVLTYNGNFGENPADLGATQVTAFTVTTKDATQAMTVNLDQKYSYGTMVNGVFTKTGVAAIKTRSYPVTGSTTSIYVDFLFSKDYAAANRYIMYDPSVDTTGGSDASSSSHVVASAFTVALLAAVASLL